MFARWTAPRGPGESGILTSLSGVQRAARRKSVIGQQRGWASFRQAICKLPQAPARARGPIIGRKQGCEADERARHRSCRKGSPMKNAILYSLAMVGTLALSGVARADHDKSCKNVHGKVTVVTEEGISVNDKLYKVDDTTRIRK